jgi:hypothetical protein
MIDKEKIEMTDEAKFLVKIGLGIIAVLISSVGGCMYGMPKYNVYEQSLHGEAELAKANYSKQVAVQEAHAKMESAKLLADAEVIRAEGVAKANKIIGDSLTNNEAYLKYLFVNNLEHTQNQVIYIPTEANLPILERRK